MQNNDVNHVNEGDLAMQGNDTLWKLDTKALLAGVEDSVFKSDVLEFADQFQSMYALQMDFRNTSSLGGEVMPPSDKDDKDTTETQASD